MPSASAWVQFCSVVCDAQPSVLPPPPHGVLQRNKTNGIYRETLYLCLTIYLCYLISYVRDIKGNFLWEVAHVIVDAEICHDMLSASWGTRKAGGVI